MPLVAGAEEAARRGQKGEQGAQDSILCAEQAGQFHGSRGQAPGEQGPVLVFEPVWAWCTGARGNTMKTVAGPVAGCCDLALFQAALWLVLVVFPGFRDGMRL
jgi:hypothetical protein